MKITKHSMSMIFIIGSLVASCKTTSDAPSNTSSNLDSATLGLPSIIDDDYELKAKSFEFSTSENYQPKKERKTKSLGINRWASGYSLTEFCSDEPLRWTIRDTGGFISNLPSSIKRNVFYKNKHVWAEEWHDRSYFSSSVGNSGYDGVEAAHLAYFSGHSGTYSKNWIAPLATTSYGGCLLQSKKMSLGKRKLRYLFLSGCCSLQVGRCAKSNGTNWEKPSKTWGSRANGIQCIYGLNSLQSDWGGYGGQFWVRWKRSGTKNMDAWFGAIDTGDPSALGSVICFGRNSQDAKRKLQDTHFYYYRSKSSSSAWIHQTHSRSGTQTRSATLARHDLFPYIEVVIKNLRPKKDPVDVQETVKSDTKPPSSKTKVAHSVEEEEPNLEEFQSAEFESMHLSTDAAIAKAQSTLSKTKSLKDQWHMYQVKDDVFSESSDPDISKVIKKRVYFSKKLGAGWVITPSALKVVEVTDKKAKSISYEPEYSIALPKTRSSSKWNISNQELEKLYESAKAKMIKKVISENPTYNEKTHEVEVVSIKLGYDIAKSNEKGLVPLRFYGRVLFKEKDSKILPKLKVVSLGLK